MATGYEMTDRMLSRRAGAARPDSGLQDVKAEAAPDSAAARPGRP
jgi:hypothetical protein